MPKRALRFASIDIRHLPGGIEAALAIVQQNHADFVLMQGVEIRDVSRVASAIGVNDPERGSTFYPAQNLNGSASTWGNLIVSRYPLYDGRSIPNRGGSFGVWAVAVVDGVKFYLGSANLFEADAAPQQGDVHKEAATLVEAYQELRSPPIVLGVRGSSLDGADISSLAAAGLNTAGAGSDTGECILTGGGWTVGNMQSISTGATIIDVTASAAR